MSQVKWTVEQKSAIDKKKSNILVSASAGSGKTAVLIERVLKKVIDENIDIDKLLVVTFTNAAATELKEKLIKKIYEKLDEDKNNAFLRAQLKNINKAKITTIDAFCLDIVRSNFEKLSIDPNFKICDNAQAIIFKNEVITNILEEKYVLDKDEKQNTAVSLYKILELFSGKDENFVNSIFKIYNYIQSFSYPFSFLEEQIEKYNLSCDCDLIDTDFGKSIFDDSIKSLQILYKKQENIRHMLEGKEDFEKYLNIIDIDMELIKKCIFSNTFDELYYNLENIKKLKSLPRYTGDNEELKIIVQNFRNKILKEEIKKICKKVYTTSKNILDDNKVCFEYLKYIYDVLSLFDREYKNIKKKNNVMEFSDITHLALEVLIKKDENGDIELTDVAKSLKEKYIEIYTDEYQDTSFVQEAILNAISKGNNRFMVGDIKQSIYKFRQAMPEIFNEKYDKYTLFDGDILSKEDCKIILAKNFRSRKEVLASINYIFEKIMSKQVGDCDYSNLEVLKHGNTSFENFDTNDYKTDINIIDLKEDKDLKEIKKENIQEPVDIMLDEMKDFEIEATYIASNIKNLMQNFKIYEDGKFRNLKYKDIVILLRSMKNRGNILEDILKSVGIPVYSDSSVSIFDGEEVKLVLSFLNVLDNVYNDIDLVSIMFSIIGKFSLNEIYKIRSYNKTSTMYDSIIDAKKMLEEKISNNTNINNNEKILYNKINEFLNLLDKFYKYSKIYTVSELLVRIYKNTNIYYQFALEQKSNVKKANLELLVDYARNIESTSKSTLSSYITYINNLKNKSDDMSSAKVLGENEDVVRIMTIHKSKGLEFPVVFLCDTSRKYLTRDLTEPVIMHHKYGIGIDKVDDNYKIKYPSAIKEAIKSASLKEIASEELRMLYVALTRAKEKLVIYGTVKDYDKIKKDMFVLYDNGKIESSIVANNKSYLSNILLALNDYNENENLFNINIIKKDKMVINDILNKDEISIDKISDTVNMLYKNSNVSLDDIEKYKKEYNKILNFKYKYFEDTITNTRVSVSNLKQKDNNENIKSIYTDEKKDLEDINENIIEEKYKKPECLTLKSKKYSGARKGTLIHFILENLDYSIDYDINSLKQYIDKLVKDEVINIQDKKYINVYSILRFLKSKIGLELKNAVYVKKEEEFVLKCNDISKSTIQGVIDLYYKTKDSKIVLVDFKTDRIESENEFIEKYKKQLQIYKIAIENILNVKVDMVYIYSFNLNKEILLQEV